MPKQLNVNMAFTADTSQARKQLQDLQKTLDSLASNSVKNNVGKTMDADLQKAIVSARQLKDMIAEASNTKTGNLDLSKFSQEIQKSGRSIQQYAQDLSNLGPEGSQAFMQLAQSVAAAEVPMKRTFGLLDQFKVTLANAARWQISSSVLHGFMGALQGAYGYAQDLNKSLTDIRIVTGQSTEQMAQFAEQANKSAQALSTSTLAYTDASLIYYQQGLDADEVAARTETTLKMSNVTGESADEVSSYMTAIWNNFRKGGESLESFADKITALGAATASSSREIAGGLQQFAAIADTVGLSYDYAATALATVVAQTRQSESTVGNSFRTIFSRLEGLQLGETLEDGTDLNKYSSALATIGVDIKEQNGDLKTMDTILEEIGARWQTLSRDQQVALAQTVGGVRQYTNLIALFDNWDTFQKNLQVSMGAEGTLEEQAKRYEESWQAAQKRVQAAWQAIYQDLIDDKFFITLLNGITKVIQGLDGLIDSVGGLKGVLPIVGSLLTTIFAKDLAHGIETAVYNFKVFTGAAQESANEVAKTFQGSAEALAQNLEDEGYKAEAKGLKDQIDFTIKLRENTAAISEENRKWLLSVNELTKQYAAAWEEAEKLKIATEENQTAIANKARDIVGEEITDTKTRTTARSEISQNINPEVFQGKIQEFINNQNLLQKASEEFSNAAENAGNIGLLRYTKMLEGVNLASNDAIDYQEGLREAIAETGKILNSNQSEEAKKEALQKLAKAFEEAAQSSQALTDYLRDDAVATAQRLAHDYGLSEEATKRLVQAFKEAADNVLELNKRTEEAAHAQENYNSALDRAKAAFDGAMHSADKYSESIVKGLRGITQLLTGITSLGKAVDVLKDKDIPFLDRLKSALPSISIGFSSLHFGAKTVTPVINNITTALGGTVSATAAASSGIGSLTASIVGFLGVAWPFVLGALAIGGVAAGLWAYFNKDEIAADRAAKKTEKLKTAWEEAKASFDELYNGLTSYQEARDALDDLKQGTLEWNQAVQKLNQQVMDLIEKYPELAKYMTNEGGVLGISEEGWQDFVNQEYTKGLDKQFEYVNQASVKQSELDQIVDLKKIGKDAVFNYVDEETGEITGGQSNLSPELLGRLAESFGKDASIFSGSVEEVAQNLKDAGYTAENVGFNIRSLATALVENENVVNAVTTAWDALNQAETADTTLQRNYLDSIVNNEAGSWLEENAGEDAGFIKDYIVDQILGDWQEGEIQNLGDIVDHLNTELDNFANNVASYREKALDNKLSNITDTVYDNAGLTTEESKENLTGNIRDFYNSLDDEDKKILLSLDLDKEASISDLKESIAEVKQQMADDIEGVRATLDTDVDETEWETLTNYVHDNADEINKNAEAQERLSEDLKNSKQAAAQVAEAIIRFDDAIQDVTDHYEDWNKVLSEGSTQEKAKAAEELADAYGDLMDIDGSALSAPFLESTENLDLMKAAIEGDEDAYDSLMEKMGQDIIAHCDLDKTAFDAALTELNAELAAMDFKNLEIGANLNTGSALQAMEDLVNAAHMTKEQAEAYLASMGIDAEIEEHKAETTDNKTVSGFIPTIEYADSNEGYTTTLDENGNAKTVQLPAHVPGARYEEDKVTLSEPKEETGFTLKVKSATKSSGGGFKYKQSSHGGGTQNPSKTGSGKKGGGGGGSKKKTVKEHTKTVKNEDRYHDIKERIDDLNKSLTRLNKTEDRIYGKAKLKYMDMEIEKLEDQIKLTDEYIAEIKKYAAIDQANLRGIGMGAEFDENGMLTNYEQVLANITNSYNAAIGAYNGAIDAFNGSAQEDADNEALDNAKKQLDAAKETYDENQKILKQYEDTFNLLQEQVDKRIDQVWALFDMRLKKITFEVEFEINWNERELKYLDWLLENIGDTADKGVDKIANLAQQMNEYADTIEWAKKGIQGIFGLHGINFDFDNADPVALTDQLTDAMHRLNFESQLTEDEANALLDYCDTLMEAIDGIRDKWKAAHEAVNDTWDKWNERLERETDRLENYAKEMDSIKNIIDLTGRKMLNLSTQDIDKMNQSQIENNWAQVESWKAIMEARKASMEEAKYYMENAQTEEVREEWRKSYEQFEDDYNNAHQNYYSAWEETLEKVQDAFEETMDNLGKDYNDAMGDLTLLQEQFARKQEVDHLYLDDYEKYHELNKSADELRKSLENTNSTMMKSKMYDLLDEMNASMRDGVQISEAQAEIYARRVALLQAEAELLDAQNAKSAVRMTRDNEGNFSYTYTADQDQIDDAEGNFQDKFYEVLDYERQYMEDIQGQMLDMTEQFWSDYYDLCERYKDDSAALEEAVEALVDDYNLKMDFLVAEQEMDMGEMARLRDEDWKDFETLTGKKLANQNDFIDQFKETIVGRLRPQYQNANDYAIQWQKTVEKTTQEGNKAVDKYQSNTEKTFEKAGENIEKYGNKAVEKMSNIAGQSQVTKDNVTTMAGQMQIDMGQVMTTAWSLDSAWATVMNNMRTQIQQTVSALYSLLQRLQEVQAQAAATIAAVQAAAQAQAMANMGNSLGGGGSGGTGGGTGSGSGGPGKTTTGSGNSSYHSLYGGAGTADHAITDGNGGYVTGGTRGSGNTGYGVITTGNNTSMPTDVYAMLKRQGLVKASGGYTGAWGPEGVVNILHEKEFVLNKDDTANIFKVVDMVRQLDDKFGLSQGLNNLASSIVGSGSLALAGTGAMDQNVHIEANFPNVQSHTEIETALNNLVNSAAQYVNRK